MTPGASDEWLVVVDMQRVFADPGSDWVAPRFPRAAAAIARLLPRYAGRTVFTRFIAPDRPVGSWEPYYERWPAQRRPPEDPEWDIVPELQPFDGPVVTATTFGKWNAETALAVGGASGLLLTGVSTDCCVLSTALAAADAGVFVRVAGDACAGATEEDHDRALAAMALYAPLIEVVDVAAVLGEAPLDPHDTRSATSST